MKQSKKEISRITATEAADTAREILERKDDRLVHEMLDQIDKELIDASKSGSPSVHLMDINMGELVPVSVLDRVVKDLRDRGFEVIDESIIGEPKIVEEVDLEIIWIDSTAKGKKK